MKPKTASPFAFLLSSLIFFTVGLLCVFWPDTVAAAPIRLVRILLLGTGGLAIFAYLANRRPHLATTAALGVLYIILAGAIHLFPQFFSPSFLGLTGFLAYINAMQRFVYAKQLHDAGERGTVHSSLDGALSLFFAVLSVRLGVLPPYSQQDAAGAYLLFYGVNLLGDFTRELLRWDEDGLRVKRYIRLPMPVFLATLVPLQTLHRFNRNMRPVPEVLEIKNAKRMDSEPCLEIFIHLAADCARGLGHVDLSLDGTVYSYGCYDLSVFHFYELLSDGVMAVAPRDTYLKHCCKTERKAIVGFGVVLDEEQKQAVYRRIGQLMKKTVDWQCPQEHYPDYRLTDPTSLLYNHTGARFYKFRSGKYKYYFALATNCVQLADALIGASGLNLHGNNGIITPGTYMDFLNRLFKQKNSCVVTRTVYF